MVGFYSEYVPCGCQINHDWVLSEEDRSIFRHRILQIRKTRPIVLVQFPQDEYGEANICSAAGRASLHINAQGNVEPCPFVPVSCDSIRQGSLAAACRSSFLNSIRNKPELLKRRQYACALFEHLSDIEEIARQINGSYHCHNQ